MKSYYLYFVSVCCIALSIISISTSIALYNFIIMLKPELGIGGKILAAHQDNGLYRKWYNNYYPSKNFKILPNIKGKDLTQLRQNSLESLIRAQKHDAIISLIRSISFILINIIIFPLHWHFLKKEKEN